MKATSSEDIILFTARWCPQAVNVERFLRRNNIPMKLVNIDRDTEGRHELIALTGGFASVPTLLFPDGTRLTEPSFAELKEKLDLEDNHGLSKIIRSILRGKDSKN